MQVVRLVHPSLVFLKKDADENEWARKKLEVLRPQRILMVSAGFTVFYMLHLY